MSGALSILVLMAGSCLLALGLQNAFQNFQYMMLFGAGTGLLYHPALVLVEDQCGRRNHSHGRVTVGDDVLRHRFPADQSPFRSPTGRCCASMW